MQVSAAASPRHILAGPQKGDKLTPGGIEPGGFQIRVRAAKKKYLTLNHACSNDKVRNRIMQYIKELSSSIDATTLSPLQVEELQCA